MVLSKSKKSAVIMGIFFVIPTVTSAFIVGEIRYSTLDPAERNPNVANGSAGIVSTWMSVSILLFLIGIASLVIYQLNESHYGRQGAIRWAIAGTIYGLLQQVVLTPIPSDFYFGVVSIMKQIGGYLLWKVTTIVLSYLLVFPLFSAVQNWRRKSRRR